MARQLNAVVTARAYDGARYVGPDDLARAVAAAERVFRKARADVLECRHEWRRFCAGPNGGDPDFTQGPARVWWEAECAANAALTEGWRHADAAACEIDAEPVE